MYLGKDEEGLMRVKSAPTSGAGVSGPPGGGLFQRLASCGADPAEDRTAKLRALLAASQASSKEQDKKLNALRTNAVSLSGIFKQGVVGVLPRPTTGQGLSAAGAASSPNSTGSAASLDDKGNKPGPPKATFLQTMGKIGTKGNLSPRCVLEHMSSNPPPAPRPSSDTHAHLSCRSQRLLGGLSGAKYKDIKADFIPSERAKAEAAARAKRAAEEKARKAQVMSAMRFTLDILTYMYMHVCTHKCVYMCMHTHTCTRARARTHTHMYIETRKMLCVCV